MARPLKDYAHIGTIMSDWVFKNLPFVFFLFFLGLIYIANSNYADKQVRQIQALEKDIKEMKWKFNDLKGNVMLTTKQSEIEKKVEVHDLRASNQRTKRIVISESK
jgi:cell division protein FtsL